MNTITLADLTDDNASSGNSLLAVTQQLSISLRGGHERGGATLL